MSNDAYDMLRGLSRSISKEILELKLRIYSKRCSDSRHNSHQNPVPDRAHILVDVTTRQVDAVTTRRSASPCSYAGNGETPGTNSGVVAW